MSYSDTTISAILDLATKLRMGAKLVIFNLPSTSSWNTNTTVPIKATSTLSSTESQSISNTVAFTGHASGYCFILEQTISCKSSFGAVTAYVLVRNGINSPSSLSLSLNDK